MKTTRPKDPEAQAMRLILKVARDVLRACPPPDRVDALKLACARLHIPYNSTVVREAVDILECRNGRA